MWANKTKAELQAVLKQKGLPTSGNKDVLIGRLNETMHESELENKNLSDTISDGDQDETVVENMNQADSPEMEQADLSTSTPNIRNHRQENQRDHQSSERYQDVRENHHFVNPSERFEFEMEILRRERELMALERTLLERERSLAASSAGATPQQDQRPQRRFTIREIADILPEFNPIDKSVNSADKFIKRIRDLASVYDWDQKLVLFAAQSKLKGFAKSWNDNSSVVYQNFDDFAEDLVRDFPLRLNTADVHIELLNSVRANGESEIEYCYRMSALGRKGGLDEAAIVTYIRRGIQNSGLQNALSCVEITSINELHGAITRYVQHSSLSAKLQSTSLSAAPVRDRYQHSTSTAKATSGIAMAGTATATSAAAGSSSTAHQQKSRGPTCFNCYARGHIRTACPQPPRRVMCYGCKKFGHHISDCPEKKAESVMSIADMSKVPYKDILVSNIRTKAIVDSGSSRSLVRETFARSVQPTEPCSLVTLKGFGGGKTTCVEKMVASVRIDDKTFKTSLLVVADDLLPADVLLGSDLLLRDGNRLVFEEGDVYIEPKTDNVNKEELPEVVEIIDQNADCFSTEMNNIGRCNTTVMKIEVTSSMPVNRPPYRIPFAKREAVNGIVSDLLSSGIIVPSKSPYASPIVLVKKSNGEDRLCVDYRELNSVTTKQPFPMPIIEELLATLAGNRYFTTLDLMSGYYQIPIDKNSQKYTAFVTHDGHFEYTRMPFGLVNAPSVFQQCMNEVQKMMSPGEVVSYLDDTVIPSVDIAQGLDRLKRFMQVLRTVGLTLRLDKCVFMAENIKFLGHNVSANGIQPGDGKVTAIQNFPTPRDVPAVRRFLGLTGFFRKFVENYATLAAPLTKLLKTIGNPVFLWAEEQEISFGKLKERLCSQPVLCLFDAKKPHEVHTDASAVGLAGVLMQNEGNGIIKPVFYYSRHCSSLEGQYHSYELEVLAIVESLARFRVYLMGKHFRVVTDCAAVTTTRLSKPLLPRIARWWLKLQEYDFELVHRAGTQIAYVDALSRAPSEAAREVPVVTEGIFSVEISVTDWLVTMQQQDTKLLRIMKILRKELQTDEEQQIKTDYQLENHRLFRKVNNQLKWVVPAAVRWRIVKGSHDDRGHFGVDKTLNHLQEEFWFPRMRNFVKGYIAMCVDCCYNKRPGGAIEGQLHFTKTIPVPFRTIHIDHIGPFPKSSKGNTHVVGLADEFSKFVIVKAVNSTDTRSALALLNDMTLFFGLPTRIVSDRCTSYTSRAFAEYCSKNAIQHIQNAVRTPRANGQIERVNQLILHFLRTSVKENNKWDTKLKEFQWIINSQVNSTIKCCPNDVVFQYKVRDGLQNKVLAILNIDSEGDRSNEREREVPSHEEIAKRIDMAKQKWKERFDSKHKTPTVYMKDDLVVIENEPKATGESKKLEPRYRGPYVVEKVLDRDRYVISDLEDIQRSQRPYCSVFSSDKMKPWCKLTPEEDDDDDDDDD